MPNRIMPLTVVFGLLGAAAANAQTTQPVQQQTPPPAMTAPSPSTPSATATNFLVQQQPGQKLASDYLKKSILGANNERIGEVTDLVVSSNGEIIGVVVGVGGFLGIGEKSVGLPLAAVTYNAEANQLTAPFTRQDLEKAPEFVTRTGASGGSSPPATGGGTQR